MSLNSDNTARKGEVTSSFDDEDEDFGLYAIAAQMQRKHQNRDKAYAAFLRMLQMDKRLAQCALVIAARYLIRHCENTVRSRTTTITSTDTPDGSLQRHLRATAWLDYITVSGTPLAVATKEELQATAADRRRTATGALREAAWLDAIDARLKSGQVVADVLDEAQLAALRGEL